MVSLKMEKSMHITNINRYNFAREFVLDLAHIAKSCAYKSFGLEF